MTCEKLGDCSLAKYCYRYGIKSSPFEGARHSYPLDDNNPFIVRDMNKCILCGLCVRACNELPGKDNPISPTAGLTAKPPPVVMSLTWNRTAPSAGPVLPLPHRCPDREINAGNRTPLELEKVRTTCPFCGTGCNFDLRVHEGRVVGVTTSDDAVVNGRSLCIKGRFGWDFIYNEKRLTTPLIKKNGEFVPELG
jgi:formate dehydrogenase alpha subunit